MSKELVEFNIHYETRNSFDIYEPYYNILIMNKSVSFTIDLLKDTTSDLTIVFLSPYQHFKMLNTQSTVAMIKFHGDFYCIEYHKREVACNGVLFNNIYEQPSLAVSNEIYEELITLFKKLSQINLQKTNYDLPIIKTYLRLLLAICSKEKLINIKNKDKSTNYYMEGLHFQDILENNFLNSKNVKFYAEKYGVAVDSFSKKIKKQYGRSPLQLINERIILESKRMLHLSTDPIKTIAWKLNFRDEYYFSRFFKKHVGVSPKIFREKVGISLVAK